MDEKLMVAYMRNLGKQLAKARKALDLSQGELAKRSSVSLATIQRVEAGDSIGSHRSLLQLCTALHLSWPAVVTRAWSRISKCEQPHTSRTTVREGGMIGVADAPCIVRDGVLYHESGEALAGARWAEMGRGREVRVVEAGDGLWHVEVRHDA